MKVIQWIFILFLSVILVQCMSPSEKKESISLNGTWKFQLDPADEGIQQQWFSQDLSQTVNLPGSLQEQGYGNDIDASTPWTGTIRGGFYEKPKYEEYRTEDDFKVPFFLNPEKYYQGAAWYQKQVKIPGAWQNQRIILCLERPHWETMVFVDDQKVGVQNSLSTPHEYDLTDYLVPGNKHRLSIRVDNRMIILVGPNSHSVTDHTQTNWNGIAGDLEIKTEPLIFIEDVQVYPDLENKQVKVKIQLGNESGAPQEGKIILQVQERESTQGETFQKITKTSEIADLQTLEVIYPMGKEPQLWSEFNPKLYDLKVQLDVAGQENSGQRLIRFGMREFTTDGTRFSVNGRPIFLRGTLECAIFPETGYPAMDLAEWVRIFKTIKAYGLNHMRFHSWCPPEAAFIAADKAGIYLQVEAGSWANQGSELGAGMPVDEWIYQETERIAKAYGNHPSFCMMAYGNEPAGDNQEAYLTDYIHFWKDKDSRRVYTGGSGWPVIEANEFHVTPTPRIQRWGEGLQSIVNKEPPHTTFDFSDFVSRYEVPVIGHEIGQWCVYPNFEEMEKYTGVLKPKNFEIFNDMLKDHHILDQAHQFHMASGKLQALLYKADIEAALRTPGFAGFQLLDLHDFPGQGTALVGVLDPFWNSKEYITPSKYREFSGQTVPLAEMDKRLYRNSESFQASIEIAHFGQSKIKDATVQWKIKGKNRDIIEEGAFSGQNIGIDNCQKIGDISYSLNNIQEPQKLTLTITMPKHGKNSWDFWVYPDELVMPEKKDVFVATAINQDVKDKLSQGQNVLLILNDKINDVQGGKIKVGFSTIFWNTLWTDNQAPHTMGVLCDPEHPVFDDFPTAYYSNWQWWDIVTGAQVMNMKDFPKEITPLIQAVPDYHKNQKLAFAFEGRVGEGKVLVTSIDLVENLEDRLASRQLYYSILEYMAGQEFSPEHSISLNTLEALIQ